MLMNYFLLIMDSQKMTKAELISKIKTLESRLKDTDTRGTVEKESEEKHRRLVESIQDNFFFYSLPRVKQY